MLAATFGFGVLYGAIAYKRDLIPVPQLRQAKEAWQAVTGDLGPHPWLALPQQGPATQTSAADRLQRGLIMVVGLTKGRRNFVRIIDRDGRVVHEWRPDWFAIWGDEGEFPASRRPNSQPGAAIHGAAILDNGDLVINFDHLSTMRLDACGRIRWKLDNLGHHSVHVGEDGSLWVGAERHFDEQEPPYQNHGAPLNSWTIQHLSAAGEILETIALIDVLQDNDLLGLLYLSSLDNNETRVQGDTLHLNDVETFPGDLDSPLFEPGDLLVSLRNINTLLVLDPESKRVKYRATGPFLRQHDPDFVDGGRILVFDNRNLMPSSGPEPPRSRILLLDPMTDEIQVIYGDREEQAFFTDILGKQQQLANGNLLITAAREGRAFEVTPEGERIWEYNNLIDDTHSGVLTQVDLLPETMDRAFFQRWASDCKTNP